ncbi:MAG: prolyl oligopeptidase family serine peptidase [Vicinamibacterales bacterium]
MSTPYGTWASPLTASLIASQSIGIGSVLTSGGSLYWLESRPHEMGRVVIVRQGPDGSIVDVTAPGTNVRSRVHEYGGGAYTVHGHDVYYVNFADQRLYQQRDGAAAVPITPEGRTRYADFAVDVRRQRLICVREDHSGDGEAVNTLVSVPMDSSGAGAIQILASGYDFYSTPRLSPDGETLTFLAWRHPNMPWDGTELHVASVAADGLLTAERIIAGGPAESICQPGWSPDGDLYFVSDRDGWWRFYRIRSPHLRQAGSAGDAAVESLVRDAPVATEFGRAQWVLGSNTWAFTAARTLLTVFTCEGRSGLALIDVQARTCRALDTSLEPVDNLAVLGGDVIFPAASARALPALARMSLSSGEAASTIRVSSPVTLDPAYVSDAEPITFPGEGGRTARAFYYAPNNPGYAADSGERPPLIVISHGGPTDAAKSWLRLTTQYWTTRGFALVDVDYGGSTGFGRAYRERLNGQWGVVDVADCVSAAQYLVEQGKADPDRLIIRGGSAGGYTTLCALTFRAGVFKVGASYYGISDLEVLVQDTHKFESRYTDTLIGPYPEARDLYHARSPIHAVDKLSCPLILFHGAEDKMVPPNQAELMAAALRAKGVPVALLIFEGEQHGFRKSANVIRALEAELWFYGKVFGFTPADVIDPVEVAGIA